MPKRGTRTRPPTRAVATRLPEPLAEELRAEAMRSGRTISQHLRDIVLRSRPSSC